ncbi:MULTISPECIES: PhoX family phosphatase [unclassified Actinopolyspora]|uniref:PhoX family protein n=1 Tax=unclassified Actinopolyspora TaxID=2639451 RepID=UPI0013F5E8C0|nr:MULTISPECIES: PhoX family phosphatase [unclassified Actinopolyspora]NHD16324.1 PhoX family phosphatase [Actinopolyspora sp. BKK2]NHE75813.1 PhoX family phosphatase [Actinopolyspora sp. BKK1]
MSTNSADQRMIPLPLATHHTASRSATTCEYRCGNACAHDAPNTSANTYFGDIVRRALDRRGVLRAGAVLSLTAGVTAATGIPAAARGKKHGHTPAPAGIDFDPVPPNTRDGVVIPEGYDQEVVIRWGDPVLPGAPEFDFDNQSEAAQRAQFGYNNDFAGLVPLDNAGIHSLLVVNHEYTSETYMFSGYDPQNPTEEQVRIAWAAHGLTVVQVKRDPARGGLVPLPGWHSRRITANTEFAARGPAAGSELLRTSADPEGTSIAGTIANCAGGVTPWGTILSGEENFHQYFAHADQVNDPVAKQRMQRYGINTGSSTRKWERFDQRWDASAEPNETNRFGWVVEIDPNDPNSTPVKHTALGRFKHEGATVRVAEDGHVVVYMGDDERFEYIYKFVSSGRVKNGRSSHARRHNMSLLDEGTLYVARFSGNSPESEIDGSGELPSDGEFDGAGEWLPLATGDTSHVPGFTAEEVYVFTRLAADEVAPTKMDRPEDIEPNPVNGRVYGALTNNSNRGTPEHAPADEPNPRAENKHGHVLELAEKFDDPTATKMAWRLLLVCGDPQQGDTYFGGFDKDQVSPISCPDNVAFDRHGNLWIATDGNGLGSHDGLFAVPVDGPARGHVKQFLTVPSGAETCGPIITDELVTVCVQHPGENGSGAENPGSHWPDGGRAHPRPSMVAVWRTDGHHVGEIGKR